MKIKQAHECFWASQHQAVQILEYEEDGWTLFVDHSKIEGSESELEYRLDVDYCPYCGTKLNN